MGVSLAVLLALALAPSFATVLAAAALMGIGSSVFHPESSRVARRASGGKHGMAQSLFQVGGNAGSALGPLLATFILPRGQRSIAWFSFVALLGIILLADIGAWTKRRRAALAELQVAPPLAGHVVAAASAEPHLQLPRKKIVWSLAILVALMFSKYFYLASLGSYYTFYLMDKFHVSMRSAEIHLFAFFGAVAAGKFFCGPLGDPLGGKVGVLDLIFCVLPFTLLLAYSDFFLTGTFCVVVWFVFCFGV